MHSDVDSAEGRGLSRRRFLGQAAKVGGAALAFPAVAAARAQVATRPATVAAQAGKTATLKWGSVFTPGSVTLGVENYLAKRIEQLTHGQVKVTVFPNSELGTGAEMFTQARGNTIQGMDAGSAEIGSVVKELPLLELPYLFNSIADLNRTVTEMWGQIDELMAAQGFRLLGNVIDGPRQVISSSPVKTPDDLRGAKMRVPSSPVYIGMAKTLGANPTPTPFNEVYTDMQTHLIDAAEGSLDTFVSKKWYEVMKHVALTNHVVTPTWLIINKKFVEGLGRTAQKGVLEAGREATAADVRRLATYNKQQLAVLKSKGVSVTAVDSSAFRDKLESFNSSYAKSQGDAAAAFYREARWLA